MKNKKAVIILVLIIIVGAISFYQKFGSSNLIDKTYEYLEGKNCLKRQVKGIDVKRSFLNLILSRDVWIIKVNLDNRYEYIFTYKNDKIFLKSLKDEGKLSKEDYQKAILKLENGELCNSEEFMLGEKSKYVIQDDLISLSIKENSLTNSSATLILTNHTDNRYVYGEGYWIEKEKDGIWYSVNLIVKSHDINMIAYYLGPRESREKEIKWDDFYGKLIPGKYRIIDYAFVDDDKISLDSNMYFAAEFVID